MSDIFISYAKADRSRAEILAQALAGYGWSIFWDRTIPIGRIWRATIEKELNQARCVIVVWSKASIASGFVQEEADDAKRRGVIVPVLIEDVQPPIGFRSLQTADLTDWNATAPTRAFRGLIADIAELIGSPRKETEGKRTEPEGEREPEEGRIVQEHFHRNATEVRWRWIAALVFVIVASFFVVQFSGTNGGSPRQTRPRSKSKSCRGQPMLLTTPHRLRRMEPER